MLARGDHRYDRRPGLTEAERAAVSELAGQRTRRPEELSSAVARLTDPIDDVLGVVTPHAARWGRGPVRRALVAAMAGAEECLLGVGSRPVAQRAPRLDAQIRQLVVAVSYLLCGQRDLHLELRGFKARKFAGRVLAPRAVEDTIAGRRRTLTGWLSHGAGAADAHHALWT